MNEKQLTQLCFFITLISGLILTLTYTPEFEETNLNEILNHQNSKGKVFGKVDYVITTYPTTSFVLNDGTTATIYYPKATTIEKDNFVTVYLENQGKKFLFAQKVVKD
jgi:hypothetical protein